ARGEATNANVGENLLAAPQYVPKNTSGVGKQDSQMLDVQPKGLSSTPLGDELYAQEFWTDSNAYGFHRRETETFSRWSFSWRERRSFSSGTVEGGGEMEPSQFPSAMMYARKRPFIPMDEVGASSNETVSDDVITIQDLYSTSDLRTLLNWAEKAQY